MKKLTKILLLPAIVLPILLSAATGGFAAGAPRVTLPSGKSAAVRMTNGEPFVSLCGLALLLDGGGRYETRTRTIFANACGHEVSASAGADHLTADGRRISGGKNYIASNILYVPLSSAAEAFGFALREKTGGYALEKSAKTGDGLDPDCVLWLARIIFCESRDQPYEGQLAVGTVVMNRVASPEFPDTVFSVIFDRKYGVQFTPAGTGAVWCTPDERSVAAAREVLGGFRTDPKILYFMNEAISTSTWMRKSRPYAFTIGDHSFFF